MKTPTKLAISLLAVLLVAVISGCNNDDHDSGGGGGGGGGSGSAPTILSTYPADGATAVPVNSTIIARFSEAMDPATIIAANFTVVGPGTTAVTGTVSYDSINFVAEFLPSPALAASTSFLATVSVGVEDVDGNAMAVEYSWSFTTGATPDVTAPTVTSVVPLASATNVPLNQIITASFSELMNTSTVNVTSFTLMDGAMALVAGSVSCPGTTASFTPTSNLVASTSYTATITTQAEDLAGNPLAADYVWSFQTGTAAANGPAPVNLGTAGNYAILAETTVTTTGTTMVTGDVGLSPAAGSFLTGWSETMDSTNVFSTSVYVTGQLFAANYAVPTPSNLTTAVADMHTAYTDAAGRTLPDSTDFLSGNIDGQTMAPGLYKWGSSVNIPNDLELNGGANDVWIFQISGDLVVGTSAMLTLTGGALPENIFWQIAGEVTFGAGANFKGILLCQTQIVFQNGAVLNGRALAQTAVTLIGNPITEP